MERGVGVAPNEDCCIGMSVGEFINGNFKDREFMDKLIIEATCGKIYGNVDSGGIVWMFKDNDKNSAGGYIDYSSKLIKIVFPEHKDTTLGTGCGQREFRIQFVIRVERATVFWKKKSGGKMKIRLEEPWFRNEDKVWIFLFTKIK